MPENTDTIESILARTRSELAGPFNRIDWAEDEIAQAQQRHPASTDKLHHAFALLTVSPVLQREHLAEFVFRSHYREILERVAGGQDTRPATAAEIACACSHASMIAPLNTAATGLYMRMWNRAFPGQPNPFKTVDDAGHYEAIAGTRIDDFEAEAHRKLAMKDRILTEPGCNGLHHGQPAPDCRYFTGSSPAGERETVPAGPHAASPDAA
jgi:hypothetical protein